jgi:pentatricopeptide repeat protein
VRIPPGGGSGNADIAIATGHDITIAGDYLGILPGATGCPATNQEQGINISDLTSGAAGSGNGTAYIYGSVIGCHAKNGVVSAASYVYVGMGRAGNVVGNYIGTAGDGIHAAGNGYSGVDSVGDHVTIRSNRILFNLLNGVMDEGNGSTIDFNVISSNGVAGLLLDRGDDKEIVGNLIGTTTDGLSAAPNGADGIWILGGTRLFLSGNNIAHNLGPGIGILGSSTHASIQDNDIFSNGGLPIDLGTDGATPNGTKFPPGPNDWLPYPTITSSSGNVILGATCPSCVVYLFRAIGDPAQAGGGGTVVTNAFANASGEWGATLPPGMTRGDVTMTAGDSRGDTSEMSPRPPFRDGFESGNTALWSAAST